MNVMILLEFYAYNSSLSVFKAYFLLILNFWKIKNSDAIYFFGQEFLKKYDDILYTDKYHLFMPT